LIKRITRIVAALALCLAAATQAYAGNYIGVSAVNFDQRITVPGASDRGSSTGSMVELGSDLNELLAVEIRFGGTQTAHFSKIGASQNVTLYSYLLRARLPISSSLWIYGLWGLTTGQATPGGSLVGSDVKRDSTSYGGGLLMQGMHWGAGVEWMRYWHNVNVGPGINITIDSIAGTLSYAF